MKPHKLVALAVSLAFTFASPDLFGVDDPIKKIDRVYQNQRDWEKAREETTKQLDGKNAQLAKAKQDTDLDARVREIDKLSKENVKEGLDGVKEAVKSAASGEAPWEAGRTALQMTHNFVKAKQAEGEIVNIAYDDGHVQEKVADLQKEVDQLKKDLQVEGLVINASQQQIAKLQSSVSLSAQMNALAGQLLAKAAAAQQRQQERLAAEARAEEAARQQAAAAAAQAQAARAQQNYMHQHGDTGQGTGRGNGGGGGGGGAQAGGGGGAQAGGGGGAQGGGGVGAQGGGGRGAQGGGQKGGSDGMARAGGGGFGRPKD
jgi:hypothetical protein